MSARCPHVFVEPEDRDGELVPVCADCGVAVIEAVPW